MLWKDVIIFKEKHAHNLCVRKTCVLKKNQPLRMRVPNRRSPSLKPIQRTVKSGSKQIRSNSKDVLCAFSCSRLTTLSHFYVFIIPENEAPESITSFSLRNIFRNCESLYLHFISILSLNIFACASRNLLIRWPTWAV